MITIGTRGSALALAQTYWIKERIAACLPEEEVSVQIIKTSADKDTTTSLRSVPTAGVFVKELEQALLRGEIDLAVHSMKDVPTLLADGLQISAIPEREDARDALISARYSRLADLPPGARVGTGSFRRQAQILALRPDLHIVDIRGNVHTRLQKMENGHCDALVLACAGLRRLGLQHRMADVFDYGQMLPAPGQGALAVETRCSDARMDRIAQKLNHPETSLAVLMEREFLRRLGGGCNVPIAIYARQHGATLAMDGLVASPDGTRIVRESIQDQAASSAESVAALADRLLALGGREILEQFRLR